MGSSKLHAIRISVETDFVEEKSSIEHNRYFFSYTITISNDGIIPAQLVSRHWIITDANEQSFEVKGLGVANPSPDCEEIFNPHFPSLPGLSPTPVCFSNSSRMLSTAEV